MQSINCTFDDLTVPVNAIKLQLMRVRFHKIPNCPLRNVMTTSELYCNAFIHVINSFYKKTLTLSINGIIISGTVTHYPKISATLKCFCVKSNYPLVIAYLLFHIFYVYKYVYKAKNIIFNELIIIDPKSIILIKSPLTLYILYYYYY